MSTILVTGGAGFVGSHVNAILLKEGYNTVVYDNLSRGTVDSVVGGQFVQGDIGDSEKLDKVFSENKIDAVMHFAALAAIGESFEKPYEYYTNNVTNTLNLLGMMVKHGVKNFVFSSTAAIFGVPERLPIDEKHGKKPISPYGESKLMVEQILADFDRTYGIKSCALRYFNAAGGDPEGKVLNRKPVETNLLPIVLRAIKAGGANVTINGNDWPTPDGTPIRDYVHVYDIAQAHLSALKKLMNGADSMRYNLGNGSGYSIWEVIRAIEETLGVKVKTSIGPRRPGDPAVLVADASKAAKELGWTPRYGDLPTIIQHAWNGMR